MASPSSSIAFLNRGPLLRIYLITQSQYLLSHQHTTIIRSIPIPPMVTYIIIITVVIGVVSVVYKELFYFVHGVVTTLLYSALGGVPCGWPYKFIFEGGLGHMTDTRCIVVIIIWILINRTSDSHLRTGSGGRVWNDSDIIHLLLQAVVHIIHMRMLLLLLLSFVIRLLLLGVLHGSSHFLHEGIEESLSLLTTQYVMLLWLLGMRKGILERSGLCHTRNHIVSVLGWLEENWSQDWVWGICGWTYCCWVVINKPVFHYHSTHSFSLTLRLLLLRPSHI